MARFPSRRSSATFVVSALVSLGGTASGQTAPAAAPSAPTPAATPAPSPSVTPAASAPAPASAAASTPPATTPTSDDFAALREEVHALRAEVEAQKAAKDAAPVRPPRPLGYEPFWPWGLPPEGLSVGGYVQGQYETHQDSQDQLNASGALLNQDRFSLRRARPSLTGEWEYAALALELDANTTNGPQVDIRKAEASLQYRPDRSRPPLVMATMGLFDTPFGYELVESPRTRFFMERSTMSRAIWPGEPDVGLRLAGAASFFRWTIGVLNGHPLGDPSYAEQDPISPKDVLFRFGVDTAPLEDLHVAGGLSAIHGQGFHPGTTPAGATVQWKDVNEDGAVQASELVGVAPQNATPSQNFDRWMVGADLRMSYRWWLGVAKIYGEFYVAQNYDRSLYVADPVASGLDQREIGFYVAGLQQITKWGEIGLRYDYYDPNSNAFDKRGGSLIPFSEAITTVSPLAALVLPDRARLVLQYDAIKNGYARSALGVPTNLKDNVMTLRLQVEL
jgi:hypothetical protein